MKKLHYFIIVALFTLTTGNLSGQELVWKQTNGPNAGYINCIVEHDNSLYVGTDGMGVFRSDADGKNWTLISDRNITAWSICFMGDTIYAGTLLNGIIRTTDAGKTWKEINIGVPRRVIDKDTTLPAIRALIVRENVIFAGTFNFGLLRSFDAGEHWERVPSLSADNVICTFTEGQDFYTGTNKGIYRSGDNGSTWTALNTGLSEDAVYSIVKSGTAMFAGMYQSGVYRSDDGGNSWRSMNNGLTLLQVWGMYAAGNTLYAGTHGNGIFRAATNDTSWSAVVTGFGNSDVRAFFGNGSTLYAGTFNGILKTSDSGDTWSAVGLPRTVISSLTSNGNSVFAGVFAGGVARTDDYGETWNKVNNGAMSTATIVQCLATKENSVFAGIYGSEGVYRTDNNGAAWVAANNGLPASTIWDLETNGTEILAGTTEGVYRSTDNGENWGIAGESTQTLRINCLAVRGATIVVGTPDGIWRSQDNGITWAESSNGITNKNINALHVHGQMIFAGAIGDGGIFRSTDNGDSWQSTGSFSGMLGLSFFSKGTTVFAGTNNGVFLTEDDGATWKQENNGLSISDVNALTIQGTKLFAGTNGGGVFRTDANTGVFPDITQVNIACSTLELLADNATISVKCNLISKGRLVICSLAGNELFSTAIATGEHIVQISTENLPTGVYFIAMTSTEHTVTRRLCIIK